ncbi:hypothetical protein SP15_199 [Bacillus phage SP-15]|uniref:Uncharacterized protein n=1 Tax=Bacillus phage SP-15 TaxID=1792032 RepID=A0A127AWD0_9CAUD|nr:hypothetical protein SP15_199 [Bacillus phage SP-15]AMM44999.1 hypothetical protein SP15_199 [Bacillus phage SP-15]
MAQDVDPIIQKKLMSTPIPELARMINVQDEDKIKEWFRSNDIDLEATIMSGGMSRQKAIYLYNLHTLFKFLNDRTMIQILVHLTDALRECITAKNGNFNKQDKVADNLVKCMDVINHHLYVAINVRD